MSTSLPRVQVLLATYNGAVYLREQVDSLLAQQGVAVCILARDDGSSDATRDILDEYSHTHAEQFRILVDGESTGSAKGNFLRLLRACDADYIAFADQDDLWLPDKLADSMGVMQALEASHPGDTPLLVYTDLRVVDAALETQNESLWRANHLLDAERPKLASLLTENVVTGCTALMNRALSLRMQNMPAEAQMHDHWAALLAASTGALRPLPKATVLYRQHGSNVVGAIATTPSLPQKLLRFVSSEGADAREQQLRSDRAQAAALLRLHGDAMPASSRKTIEAFLQVPGMTRMERIIATTRYGLWRSDPQRRIAQAIDLLR